VGTTGSFNSGKAWPATNADIWRTDLPGNAAISAFSCFSFSFDPGGIGPVRAAASSFWVAVISAPFTGGKTGISQEHIIVR
jgi:hypothetical protein